MEEEQRGQREEVGSRERAIRLGAEGEWQSGCDWTPSAGDGYTRYTTARMEEEEKEELPASFRPPDQLREPPQSEMSP